MKLRFWFTVAMLGALLVAGSLTASATTLTFNGGYYKNVYAAPPPDYETQGVGPYSFKLNGANIIAICNDINGHVNSPNFWDVKAHDLTNASLSDPPPAKFYNGTTVDEVDYRVGAWLSNEILKITPIDPTVAWANERSDPNDQKRTDLQLALWKLFTGSAVVPQASLDLLADAVAAVGPNGDGWDGWSKWQVLTAMRDGTRQEVYIHNTPEASALAGLGLNVAALGLLGFAFRRRLTR